MPVRGNFAQGDIKGSGSLSEEGVFTLNITETKRVAGDPKSNLSSLLFQLALGKDSGGLKCSGGSVNYLGNQLFEVTETFTGMGSDKTYYLCRAGAGQEPIETHEDFTDVLAGTPDNPLNDAVFDTDSEEAKFSHWPADAPHKLGGVSEYLVPSIEVQEVKLTSNTNWGQNAGAVGKKRTPANRPVIDTTKRDWLCTGFEQEFHQGYTKMTTTYRMSAEGGWNTKIYDS